MKYPNFFQLLHLTAVILFAFRAAAVAQVDWQWRAPLAAGHSVNSVAYGSGKFVAVGEGWMTSTDGKTWEDKGLLPRSGGIPAGTGVSEVAYGNGYFVAVGAHGRILRSLHGDVWTDLSFDQTFFNTTLSSVTYGKGRWIITANASGQNENADIYLSTDDCTTLTKVSLPTTTGRRFTSVRYGAGPTGSGQFVAAGSVRKINPGDGSMLNFASFFSSQDGETWLSFEEGTPARSTAIAVVWDGLFNKWLAVVNRSFDPTGYSWSSDNGVLWTEVGDSFNNAGSNYPIALSYGKGRIAAVSAQVGFVSTSQHGNGWQAVLGPLVGAPGTGYPEGYHFSDLTFSEDLGRWVAVGLDGQIAWSDAPLVWRLGVSEERRALDVGRALGDFYAVDPMKISRSSDGIAWTTVFDADFVGTVVEPNPPAPGEPLETYGPNASLFRGLGVSLNEMVAVGREGRIFTSSTGTAWASQDNWFDKTKVIDQVRATTLHHAARGPDGRWVVVGTEGFIASTAAGDSGTWVVRESNTTGTLLRVLHTGTAYVAVGASGTIVTSDNGSAWVPRTAPGANNQTFTALAVSGSIGNQVLVASGGNNLLFTSHDHGQTWVERPLPLIRLEDTMAATLDAVCWSGSEFVGTGPGGAVLVSPDGINWAGRKSGATFGARSRAMATDGSVFVMAAGGLLSSPVRTVGPLNTLTITATNGTVTRFPNLPSYETGTVVRLTASPNAGYRFANWSGGVPFDLRTSINVVVNGPMSITGNFSFVPPSFSSLVMAGSTIQNLTSSGTWPWTVEQSAGPSGPVQAVGRSGLPSPSFNTSELGGYVLGPGTLTFQWKVSTRNLDGDLSFFLNDVRHTRITGETGWQKMTVTLGAGFNLLAWRYRPASTSGAYTDAGFVTDITFGTGTGGSGFTSWSENLPAGKRGPLDRNGPQQLQNRVAYALGRDPLTATADQLPRALGEPTGGNWIVRYTRRVDLPDVNLVLEYHTDTRSLAPAGPEVTKTLISTVAGVETWEATIPVGTSKAGYFRMSSSPNP